MTRIFEDNPSSIGRTPLVKLNRLGDKRTTILAKIEGRNPSYSVKCRVGANLIWDAEQRGVLRPGVEIVEPTSGNTGIALAFVSAAKGYRLTLTMPETMSIERRRVLAMFGANIVLTPGAEGMSGSIRKAEEIAASDPNRYFLPQQFKNPANPAIHERTTGPEIWDDSDGNVDVLVSGVGTGGTITGISRFWKKTKQKPLVSVAVEPSESAAISFHLAGTPCLGTLGDFPKFTPKPHKIQGIGAGFVPETLDISLLDKVETISGDDAITFARRLAREEGILSGISSGAAVGVAARLSEQERFFGKTIVVILPDAGERYLSTALFE